MAMTRTISAADTAFLLRKELGPLRSWTDFLSDCIRDRQSIGGRQLLPCAEVHDGRLFRPVYCAQEVKRFIVEVLAAEGKTSASILTLDVDRGTHWKLNRFDRDGNRFTHRRVSTPTVH